MRPHLLLVLLILGCTPTLESPDEPPRAPRQIPPATVHEAPERLVGLGDVHGDYDAMWAALTLAEVIDGEGAWIGGETVVVQAGDQLDRGDRERDILDFLEGLADEAWAAGGQLLVLHGNHEVMNVELDLRYVTVDGFEDFADLVPREDDLDAELLAYEPEERGRVAAFRPAGEYARLLAGHNTAVIVGDTVFVHGGILPRHAETGLEVINEEIQQWMLGDEDEPYDHTAGDGPLWVRDYSDETGEEECADLEETLEILGLTRMVVAHTVWDEINHECDEQVWRVDVGMASYYGGYTQVLEIRGDEVRAID